MATRRLRGEFIISIVLGLLMLGLNADRAWRGALDRRYTLALLTGLLCGHLAFCLSEVLNKWPERVASRVRAVVFCGIVAACIALK